MVNRVILIGRLGRSPELRHAQSGKSVCTFTLATDAGFGDNRKTDWHNITAFDKTAEACAKYLRKGSMVYVEGRITYDAYEKDGVRHTTTRILASDVRFIDTKTDQPANQQQPMPGYQQQSFGAEPQAGYSLPSDADAFFDDNNVPF